MPAISIADPRCLLVGEESLVVQCGVMLRDAGVTVAGIVSAAADDDAADALAPAASAALAAAAPIDLTDDANEIAEPAAVSAATGPSFVPPEQPAAETSSAAPERRRSAGPLVALAVGLLAALALGAFVLLSGSSDDVAAETDAVPAAAPLADEVASETATADPAEPADAESDRAGADSTQATDAAGTASEPDATVVPTPAPEPTSAPTAEPTAVPEPTADPLAGLPPLSSLPERGAVFRPPTLYLEGPVQTQAQADELYERAVAVVGPDNVVNNYVVRPDAPESTDGNVRVEQAVLFRIGSATISEEFIPTLELGVAVMNLNPQVQMVVEGHTDSVGDDIFNRRLSERRAQAVVDYLVGRGVERDRLEAVGFGESDPVASNDTAEGRQLNRRIEVNLLDLLAANDG